MTGLSAKIDTRKAPQENAELFLYDMVLVRRMIRWESGGRPQITATETNIKSGTVQAAPLLFCIYQSPNATPRAFAVLTSWWSAGTNFVLPATSESGFSDTTSFIIATA